MKKKYFYPLFFILAASIVIVLCVVFCPKAEEAERKTFEVYVNGKKANFCAVSQEKDGREYLYYPFLPFLNSLGYRGEWTENGKYIIEVSGKPLLFDPEEVSIRYQEAPYPNFPVEMNLIMAPPGGDPSVVWDRFGTNELYLEKSTLGGFFIHVGKDFKTIAQTDECIFVWANERSGS